MKYDSSTEMAIINGENNEIISNQRRRNGENENEAAMSKANQREMASAA
jgi:hypothetical protein